MYLLYLFILFRNYLNVSALNKPVNTVQFSELLQEKSFHRSSCKIEELLLILNEFIRILFHKGFR